jgi:CheY-like chemotaxis protein
VNDQFRSVSRQAKSQSLIGPSQIRKNPFKRPDLILMDIALGEMNGWEATRLIKADPMTAGIPVIAELDTLSRAAATGALWQAAAILS